MILTDYYKAQKLTQAQYRFDVTASTGEYDLFETLLINKKVFNVGGLSLNCGHRPEKWSGSKTDLAITKRSHNITSIKRPNIESPYGYGDINGTNDGCIIVFNSDFKETGITTIELFIARGCKNDTTSLWELFTDGEMDYEIEELRKKAVTRIVTEKV